MKMKLTAFRTYDIRGKVGVEISEDIAYFIGRAVAQHFRAKSVVVGFDARETSPVYASAVERGILDAGSDVLNIGMCGTEEMYWAVTAFEACAGVEITASHNPIDFNGMKLVKAGSRPLDQVHDFEKIKALACSQQWTKKFRVGRVYDIAAEARAKYVNQVLSFVDLSQHKALKVVINSGNGSAGPTVDAIIDKLAKSGSKLEFIRVLHKPDHTFPNGIPNPLLPENHAATADVVVQKGADMGVAFDGDFDRCFFFDSKGKFVPGEYIVGLMASIFLEKEPKGKIVHDPRVIWNTQDIVLKNGGIAVQSKTGHAFIKQTMRANDAVYGGEISAHHYFRDFAYCDSGMIPWLLIVELISKSGQSLAEIVGDRYYAYPSSGEINFHVENATTAIDRVLSTFMAHAISTDKTDGISLTFSDWRFNLRQSNTEALVRLNVEAKGMGANVMNKVKDISNLLIGAST